MEYISSYKPHVSGSSTQTGLLTSVLNAEPSDRLSVPAVCSGASPLVCDTAQYVYADTRLAPFEGPSTCLGVPHTAPQAWFTFTLSVTATVDLQKCADPPRGRCTPTAAPPSVARVPDSTVAVRGQLQRPRLHRRRPRHRRGHLRQRPPHVVHQPGRRDVLRHGARRQRHHRQRRPVGHVQYASPR